VSWHEQYGPIVRVAPQVYSISSPEKLVYGDQTECTKSDFYDAFGVPGRSTLFAESDMQNHGKGKKLLTPLFSRSTVFEKYSEGIDCCNRLFMEKLDEYEGKVINMRHWLE
jgi:hypothetical protein